MEKKSIGQFIAALRKVNGLTQKQLAEKLNVSDKAVSRWEREESLPDLSLIPVLAEIFGVTSDELLRGERILGEETSQKTNPKTTKRQMELLLSDTKTKFRIRSIIAIGVAVLGLLAAMICNFGFLRAYIGFMVGCIFYLAAIVLEAIFAVVGFSAIRFIEYNLEAIEQCKKQLVKIVILVGSIIVILFAFSLPLIIFPWDTYMGLAAGDWFAHGILYGAFAAVGCFVVWLLIDKKILSSINGPHMLKTMAIVLGVTLVLHMVFIEMVSVENFATPIIFHDIDKFVKYMETSTYMDGTIEESWIGQDVEIIYHDGNGNIISESNVDTIYYDENGNEISEEEALLEYIYAEDGKTIVKKFLWYNRTVSSYSVDWNQDEANIQVYTYEAMQEGWDILNACRTIFWFVYVIEIFGIFIWEYKNKILLHND